MTRRHHESKLSEWTENTLASRMLTTISPGAARPGPYLRELSMEYPSVDKGVCCQGWQGGCSCYVRCRRESRSAAQMHGPSLALSPYAIRASLSKLVGQRSSHEQWTANPDQAAPQLNPYENQVADPSACGLTRRTSESVRPLAHAVRSVAPENPKGTRTTRAA